jgi:anti-sigma B factor antagonist
MPDVRLSASIRDGRVLVALSGELDVTCAAAAEAAITALVTRGQWLIIDMSALDFMDCGSLSALLRVRTLARQADGDLVLAAPRRLVLRLLDLAGQEDAFCVHPSVAAAVVSIGSRRRGTVGAGLR